MRFSNFIIALMVAHSYSCNNSQSFEERPGIQDSVALEYERSLKHDPYYQDGLSFAEVDEYFYITSDLDSGYYACLVDTVLKKVLKCAIVRSMGEDTLIEEWNKKNDYFLKISLSDWKNFHGIQYHKLIFYFRRELNDVSRKRNKKNK